MGVPDSVRGENFPVAKYDPIGWLDFELLLWGGLWDKGMGLDVEALFCPTLLVEVPLRVDTLVILLSQLVKLLDLSLLSSVSLDLLFPL
jgi:hypothetical protein